MTTPMGRSVAFKLIPLAETALDKAVTLTGHSRTDVINRALQAYAFLEEQRAAGNELLVRSDDVTERFGWDG